MMKTRIWTCASAFAAVAQLACADEPGTLIQLSGGVLVLLGISAALGIVRVIRGKRS